MFAPSSPVTGAPQTGLTTPTYTFVTDFAPDTRSKQFAVTALGGTQTGVSLHSAANPFTFTFRRPSILKTLAMAVLNGVTGQYSRVPFNEYVAITRKGAAINTAGQILVNEWRTTIKIFAGSDVQSAPEIRAGASFHIGMLSANSSGIGDTVVTGLV